uniref:Uncharacterized protein n=1 Tax=Riptortus pedestris TaxID=329032 RepID=R4WIF1_RIPPE|nr:unknown secreted protein [Riptortus pedestris]
MFLLLLLLTPLVASKSIPEDRLENTLNAVIRQAEAKLSVSKPLADLSFSYRKVFLWMPIELELVARDIVVLGPTKIEPVGVVKGEEDSSSSFLEAEVILNGFKTKSRYFLLNIFGLKYEGSAEISMSRATASLTLKYDKDPFHKDGSCAVTLSEPKGMYKMTIGEPGTIIYYLSVLLPIPIDYLLGKPIFQFDVLPFVAPDIHEAVVEAFKNCQVPL